MYSPSGSVCAPCISYSLLFYYLSLEEHFKARCEAPTFTTASEKGYIRRDDDARSKLSFSWEMLCLSFCNDALSVMLIWNKDMHWQSIIIGLHARIRENRVLLGRSPWPGCPRCSVVWSFHGYSLLFLALVDMWRRSSVAYTTQPHTHRRGNRRLQWQEVILLTKDTVEWVH